MAQSDQNTRFLENDDISKVIDLIEVTPAWSKQQEGDNFSKKVILENGKMISSYNVVVIRQAMEKYIYDKKRARSYDVACMSRLYILNRYLFNVPSQSPFSRPTFGGWHGVPHSSDEINWLWPLSLNKQGELELSGEFRGFTGDDYLALDEFDYFRQAFGLRDRKK